MARLIFDVKEEVRNAIFKYAKKNGKTVKEVVLEAVSMMMLDDLSLLLKEFEKKSLTTKATKVK